MSVIGKKTLKQLWGSKIYKKSLIEHRAKVCQPVPQLSNKRFTKSYFYFNIPDDVHRPTAAAGAGKK